MRQRTHKALALLIDPDKHTAAACGQLAAAAAPYVDYWLVGGSLIASDRLEAVATQLRSVAQVPVVLFPGHYLHLTPAANGILLLSLISGRNPEFLIGQHVVAAPALQRSGLEILPTGYMLVESGQPTAASYMSGTTPLPHDKPDIAACTALAGQMLGLQMLYLDGGSGARRPVSTEMVRAVRAATEVPLWVGGGISTPETAAALWQAGADVLVIGTAFETQPDLLPELAAARSVPTRNGRA